MRAETSAEGNYSGVSLGIMINWDPTCDRKRTVIDGKHSSRDTNRVAVTVKKASVTVSIASLLSPTAPNLKISPNLCFKNRDTFSSHEHIIIMSEEAAHPTHPDEILDKHPSAPYPDI
jgi:hypothetical protein